MQQARATTRYLRWRRRNPGSSSNWLTISRVKLRRITDGDGHHRIDAAVEEDVWQQLGAWPASIPRMRTYTSTRRPIRISLVFRPT